jgi:hypothetical protein
MAASFIILATGSPQLGYFIKILIIFHLLYQRILIDLVAELIKLLIPSSMQPVLGQSVFGT